MKENEELNVNNGQQDGKLIDDFNDNIQNVIDDEFEADNIINTNSNNINNIANNINLANRNNANNNANINTNNINNNAVIGNNAAVPKSAEPYDKYVDFFADVRNSSAAPGVRNNTFIVDEVSSELPENRAKRLKNIYGSLGTIEERLNFIVDWKAYHRAVLDDKGAWSKEEDAELDSIVEDFIDQYMENGSFETLGEVYRVIGKITGGIDADIFRNTEEAKKGIDETDPKLKQRKAYYIGRFAGIPHLRHSALSEFVNLDIATNIHNGYMERFDKQLGDISKMTMRDFNIKYGYSEIADVDKLLQEQNIDPNEKVYDHYLRIVTEDLIDRNKDLDDEHKYQIPPARKTVMAEINSFFRRYRTRVWRELGARENNAYNSIKEEEKKDFEWVRDHDASEFGLPENNEWTENYAKPIIDERDKADKAQFIDYMQNKYIKSYIAKNEEFENVYTVRSSLAKADVNNVINTFTYVGDIVGDDEAALVENVAKIMDIAGAAQGVNKLTGAMGNGDQDRYVEAGKNLELSTAVESIINIFDKAEKNADQGASSYAKRAAGAFKKDVEFFFSEDYNLLTEAGYADAYEFGRKGTISAFPTPRFSDKKDQNGTEIFVTDNARYDRYMSQHRFLEQHEERQQYTFNVLMPYLKDKKAGKLDHSRVKDFNRETYEHLLRQRENFKEIKAIKHEGDTVKIYPFAHTIAGLEGDWQGDRFMDRAIARNDRSIRALEHGWTAEDLNFINNTYEVMRRVEINKDELKPGEFERYQTHFKEFTDGYIDAAIDRRRLIDIVTPIYKAYGKIKPEEREKNTKLVQETRKNKVPVLPLTPEEELRREMIKSLSGFLDELNVQHRGSLKKHQDTDEMNDLKNKVIDVLHHLHTDRDRNVYENDQFVTLLGDVVTLSKSYREAKVEEFKHKTEAQRDANVANRISKLKQPNITADKKVNEAAQKKYDSEVRKITNEEKAKADKLIKNWKPSSKMGQTRFDAAEKLRVYAKDTAKKLSSSRLVKNKRQDIINELKDKGYTVKSSRELGFMTKRPYDKGVAAILNYYGKNPAFIYEHCSFTDDPQMYSKEEFENVLGPVDIKGISSDDFAMVAYAAVLDPKTLNEQKLRENFNVKLETVKIEDIAHKNDTMYTLDMSIPRAKMAHNLLPYTLVPAKQKAKEALEAYRNGNKEPLADILTKGIKELSSILLCETDTSRNAKNFGYNLSLLEKVCNVSKKDKELYTLTVKKLGQKDREIVNDQLRIKGYLDECWDAETKLKEAAEDGRNLTEAEKKDCIKAIVRYDFLSTVHDKLHKDMIDNEPEIMKFRTIEYLKMTQKNKDKYGPNDSSYEEEASMRKHVKPIAQTYYRLRTSEGVKKLDDAVNNVSSSISPSKSEKDILTALGKKRDELKNAKKDIERKEAAKREAEAKKAEKAKKGKAAEDNMKKK